MIIEEIIIIDEKTKTIYLDRGNFDLGDRWRLDVQKKNWSD